MRKTDQISGVPGRLRAGGFGLLELMITLVIVALLVTVAIPNYSRFVERARVSKAIGDIGRICVEIGKFQLKSNGALPVTLAELPIEIPLDPWDRPYQYLNIALAGPGKGKLRKDKNLNPLNSDFDLYSMGKDGDSKGPLTAKASRDDIVRANDGRFIGLASDYDP
jgi:general secretion pathway protein G